MTPLDVFTGDQVATFFLVLARVGGLFLLAPVFASKTLPVRLRLGLAGATSLFAMPAVALVAETTPPVVEPSGAR